MERFEFGPFRLEKSPPALYRGEEFIPLTPKALDTLMLLVEESGHIVTKEQLMHRVWPDAFVEDGNLANNISALRKILNPYFEDDGPIATIARRGYRFTAPVKPVQTNVGESFSSPVWIATSIVIILVTIGFAYSLRGNPTPSIRRVVAVLPMKNLSGDASQIWLSTALSETISAELAGGRAFRVVSGENVSRMQQEQKLSPIGVGLTRKQLDDIGRDLACDLILSGNYLVVGSQIRVDVRLDEVATGQAIALATITEDAAKFLDLVTRAGSELRSNLGLDQPGRVETDAFRASFSVSPDALRQYLEGLEALRIRDGPHARDFLLASTKAEPGFALAHASLSTTWRLLGYDGRGSASAKRAFELSSSFSREDRMSIEAQYHEATASFLKAIDLYQQLWQGHPDNLEYGLKLANAQFLGGKSADTLTTVDALRKMPERDSRDVRIDLIEATAADVRGDMPRAIAAGARAADKALAAKAGVMLARARVKQGIYAFRTAKFDDALAFLRESESLFGIFNDVGGVADALRWQGSIYSETNRFDDAVAVLERASAMVVPLNYVRLAAYIQNSLAFSYRSKGDLERAARLAEQALAAARESGDRTLLANSLTTAALVFRSRGDYARARDLNDESARTADSIGEVRVRNTALNNSAAIDFLLGDLVSARKKYETVLVDDRKMGNNAGVALRLANLSRVLALQDELVEAEKMNAEECAIQESLKNTVGLAWCRTRLADLWIELGKRGDADALAKQIVMADFGSAATAPVYYARLARLQLALGHLDSAVKAIDAAEKVQAKAVAVDEQQAIHVSVIRAEVDAAQGKPAAAIARLTRARADADRRGLLTWSLDARLVLSRLDPREAAATERAAKDKGFAFTARKARALVSTSS